MADLHTTVSPAGSRVQLSRSKGWRLPPDAAKVDRSTEWGNDFRIVGPVRATKHANVEWVEWWVESDSRVWRFQSKDEAQSAAVKLHRDWIMRPQNSLLRDRIRLRFRRTRPACWCRLDQMCHGDTIAEIAATPLECQAA